MKIAADTEQARRALDGLIGKLDSPRPILQAIGESLVDSTKQRFARGVGPDGRKWEPNTPTTIGRYLSRFSSRARARRASSKRPLIGESLNLSRSINYRVDGETLLVGSPMEYAAVQQFGARKGEFGRTSRGSPIPWGDIPARPFLGLSDEDSGDIRGIVGDILKSFGVV